MTGPITGHHFKVVGRSSDQDIREVHSRGRGGEIELLAIHDELVASIPPAEMGLVLHWMVPALSPAELSGMLMGMRAEMPAPAFAGVLDLVRERLTLERWAKLDAALGLVVRRQAA